uniref:Cell division control protein 45-like protein n=1 Tax=Auxenochlorella protothecoides TaxID=3075 RepID=A0A1D2AER3_AUXPR
MIVTTPDEWVALYNAIKEESSCSEEKHVFIYASAADADSVAALRILERLFKNDMIPHGWLPVSRYKEIEEDFDACYQPDEEAMRTAILINCGAAEDVRSFLNLQNRPNVRVVIVDSHRPICHANNIDSPEDCVAVLLDESEGLDKAEIPPASIDDHELDLDDDPDSGEDVEAGSDEEPDAQRQRLDGGTSGRQARRMEARRERQQREQFREVYYEQGVSYGKPAACMIFDLAALLGQETSHMLWLALVGLTDHMVHSRIHADKYKSYYNLYESHVQNMGHLDVATERPAAEDDGVTVANMAINCRILPQRDFRFGLLWEWSLYESMLYSPYVAARLQTYTEKGKTALELLLAKLGIPLQQAQSPYLLDMKPRYKAALPERLAQHAPAFRMADVMLDSFQLQDGLKRCVNIIDVVHAATALLECGTKNETATPGAADHVDKFWRCYHALSWAHDQGELRKGLELAKRVQKALISDGGGVVQQKLFHNFRHFRIYDLSNHSINNQHLLSHPMALQRMAAFFQDQHFHHTNRRKPVVLIGPADASLRCLAVGYEATGRMQGNKLGHAFAAATEAVKAEAWHDLFDTTVIQISKHDVDRFKSELLRLATDLL